MYYMGFSYNEVQTLPVAYKRWFIQRVVRELNKGSEDGTESRSRALQHNTPELRELQGMHRAQTPSRLRRFT